MEIKPSTVLVALSGGVDSSLAAALLKEAGWGVAGLHLLLPTSPEKRSAKIDLVKGVAEHLNIPISFEDMEEEFNRLVVDPFTDSYLRGLTPNPCVMCNQVIKFDCLLRNAEKDGIRYIATGHYVRLIRGESQSVELFRGKDRDKEQSYFLHRLTRSHLERSVFPLGDMTKEKTRSLAQEMKLPTRLEPESQEICFIPGNDYRRFLEHREGPGLEKEGDIIDRTGRKVGEHSGTYQYTVGQRHGLGIASSRPYYVMEIRPEGNQVIVGRKEDLFSRSVDADSFNWVNGAPPERSMKVMAQIRYRHDAASGRLEIISPDKVRLEFDEPQSAVTPGQALVCYGGERLLGGGWIRRKAQGA
ncbi:MAG: tRNA 2-thiouridine(34) synthase MnmA [Deltaproteobacteria bacterium]|nr:tRNA 2-thiouridine(34) synthase MnmA [Deltaproteobacteria bacterium]